MPTQIGLSTTYVTSVPSFADSADIQSAFKLYHYGTENIPGTFAEIGTNVNASSGIGIAGHLKILETTKAPIASPNFTGTVILPNATVTNAMIANPSITVNGSVINLGGSVTTKSVLYGTTTGGTTTYATAPSNNIYVGANAPASPSVGDIWMW